MNKKIKYISTLVAAGLITTTGLTGAVNAATTTNTTVTPSKGVFQKLVTRYSNVVPYVLKDVNDRVTISDIKKEYNITKFNGSSVLTNETVACTGDTFEAGGETYTVLVYGDVARPTDGRVNGADASQILKLNVSANPTTIANNLELKAADLNNDGKISGADASLALKINVNKAGNFDVNLTPETKESNYALSIDGTYVNNTNQGAVPVQINVANPLKADATGLTLKVLDSKGNVAKTNETTPANFADIDITVSKNMTKVPVAGADFSKLNDGDYILQLIDVDGKTVLDKMNIVINTAGTQAARVMTNRDGWDKATMSLSTLGENNIKAVYYTVQPSDLPATTTITWDTAKLEFAVTPQGGTAAKVKAKEFSSVKDGEAKTTITGLAEKTAYKVYYVLEDVYGSMSNVSATPADILSDEIKAQQGAVDATTAVAPDLTKTAPYAYTWTAPDGATGYKVIVYKDNKIINETTSNTASYTITSDLQDSGNYVAGKYKIEVIATKSGVKDATPTMLKEIEIKSLAKVSDVQFTVEQDGKAILSWVDSNAEANVNSYTVRLYAYDETTKDYSTADIASTVVGNVTTKAGRKTVELARGSNKFEVNTAYKAEIIVNAKAKANELVNSEVKEFEGFYEIDPDTASVVKDTSMTLNGIGSISIKGKKVTNYAIKVYNYQNTDLTKPFVGNEVTTAKVAYENDTIKVTGLSANTLYAYKLTAEVDGVKGESDYIPFKTLLSPVEMKNLTVVNNATKAATGTSGIYYNDAGTANDITDDTVIIKGTTVALNSTEYTSEFINTLKVVKSLRPDDIIKELKEGEISLELTNQTTSNAIVFDATAKDMKITINGKGYSYAIETTAGNLPKEIQLTGSNTKYNMTNADAEKITLDSGVIVTGDKTYTVLAGKTPTINGVKVTPQLETKIASNVTGGEKVLNVTIHEKENKLTFENVTDANITAVEAAKIVFVADANNQNNTQKGEIIISTVGGKVTVAQNGGVNVSGNMTITNTSGEVDVSGAGLNGTKGITVKYKKDNDAKVTVKPLKSNPVAITAGFVIDNYTLDELAEMAAFDSIKTDTAKLTQLKEYFDSFGVAGKGAKLYALDINGAQDDSNNIAANAQKVMLVFSTNSETEQSASVNAK